MADFVQGQTLPDYSGQQLCHQFDSPQSVGLVFVHNSQVLHVHLVNQRHMPKIETCSVWVAFIKPRQTADMCEAAESPGHDRSEQWPA